MTTSTATLAAPLVSAPRLMGFPLEVYRNTTDERGHTKGGVSAQHKVLYVVGILWPGCDNQFKEIKEWHVTECPDPARAVALMIRYRDRTHTPYGWLEPVAVNASGTIGRLPTLTEFGGNFAGTPSPKFVQVLEQLLGYPAVGVLKIRDRVIS